MMWESLVSTAIGGLLALSGAAIGQAWQTKENRKIRAEELEREDRYRLFRDRLDAYRAFHLAFGSARRTMAIYEMEGRTAELLNDVRHARSEVWRAYTLIWLIGAQSVELRARELICYVDGIAFRGEHFKDDLWGSLVNSFVSQARVEVLRAQPEDEDDVNL